MKREETAKKQPERHSMLREATSQSRHGEHTEMLGEKVLGATAMFESYELR
jgi:hypothetical protein